MGVNISKIKANKSPIVDYGCVVPLGLYQQINEQYDMKMIQQLIISRKLSPFYKGVSDPSDIDSFIDYTITRKSKMDKESYYKLYLMNNLKKIFSLLYNNSIECPICFLYYPANINFTRCCDQPICTECFVQIKKGSADISCPYCMTDKFGVIYHCPSPKTLLEKKHQMRSTTSGLSINPYSKRKIIPSNHPAVVLLDHMKNMTSSSSSSNNTNSIQILIQSRNVTSFDRYLSSISLNSLSVQDLMFLESIRNSMKE